MDVFKLIIQIIVSGAGLFALFVIGRDFYYNLSDIRKCKRISTNGYSVTAEIVGCETHYEKYPKTTTTSSTLRCISINYEVSGKTYSNTVVLRDINANVENGNKLEIICDKNKPEIFILADDTTSKSAKNSIKWDFAYLFIAIIIWLFLFLKIGTM